METATAEKIRSTVREAYGAVAREKRQAGCCSAGTGCCSPGGTPSLNVGYTAAELAAAPTDSNLGLGCGNPQAIASLQAGERVLDLGSGGGLDAFLAARQVGGQGHVIGIDMTPEMIDLARSNAATTGITNVEFRLGDAERLPVAAGTVDVIMSNCVINLVPDKGAVFREAFRVLAAGGRLAIADVVAVGEIPAESADSPQAYTGCISGAAPVAELERLMTEAGFDDVRITLPSGHADVVEAWQSGASRSVASAFIEARKPFCCDKTLLATCCLPENKDVCCGASTHPSGCACQTPAGGAR